MLQSTPSSGTHVWLVRWSTLVLAGLAVASITFWVLQWPTPTQPVANPLASPGPSGVDTNKVAMLLGASPASAPGETTAAAPPTSYKLLGVMAQSGSTQQGSALIASEGTGATVVRVGEALSDGLVLQSVKARSVTLGRSDQAGSTVTLELPPLPGMAGTP